MKRLRLAIKPKRIPISLEKKPILPVSNDTADITVLLDQYHQHTIEDADLPFHKWFSTKNKEFPLDNDDVVIVYQKKFATVYETKSFIALQHYLHSKNCGYDAHIHWMRIKLPEI